MITNIMFAGVGGQGLILMTRITSQASLMDNYDVKSNDVVGLSQRGGMVWGNVRMGDKVYSPNIPPGEGDILVAAEPLEALRWSAVLKENGLVIMNSKRFYPTAVQQEKLDYPEVDINRLKGRYRVIELNAFEEALKIGKKQVFNVILLGVLSNYLKIERETWRKTIADNVPAKSLDMNLKAFEYGYNYPSINHDDKH